MAMGGGVMAALLVGFGVKFWWMCWGIVRMGVQPGEALLMGCGV